MAAYQRAIGLVKPIRFEYSVGYQGRYRFLRLPWPRCSWSMRTSCYGVPQLPRRLIDERWLVRIRNVSMRLSCRTIFRTIVWEKWWRNIKGRLAVAIGHQVVVYPDFRSRIGSNCWWRPYWAEAESVPVRRKADQRDSYLHRRLIQDSRSQNYGLAQMLHGWLVAPCRDFPSRLNLVGCGRRRALRTIPMGSVA